MSNYLSQLMQQTGIAPTKTSWQEGGEDLPDLFGEESGGEEIPLPEEHQEVLGPQPIQPAPVMVQPLLDERVRSESPRVPETVPPVPAVPPYPVSPPPARGEDSIPREPEVTPPTVPPLIPESTIVEEVEQVAIQSPTPNLPPAVPPQAQKEARPNFLESPREVSVQITSPLERVETLQMEQPRTEPATDSTPTPPAYWQAVRDWVAGTPEVFEEVEEVLGEQPPPETALFHQKKAIPSIILKNQPPDPLTRAEIPQPEGQQPNLQQDFVLSIGSIHLTIAAPPPEIEPPPMVPPQAAPAPDAEPFRLSRHYLRLR